MASEADRVGLTPTTATKNIKFFEKSFCHKK
nr:MAG TPA: putative transcriptional regulator [Bacteriophage sp.]